MKILLTSTSDTIQGNVDPRFGRAAYLLMMDTETNEWEVQANSGVNASGGAGIQAAQVASAHGVQAAISGDFGPHAFTALKAAGIAMYLYGNCQTIPAAIEQFKAGRLVQVDAPTHPECDGDHQG
jgi:predicted Fe-Mo cluster-binding NifX family protein